MKIQQIISLHLTLVTFWSNTYFIATVLPGELCIMPLASLNPLVLLPVCIFLEVKQMRQIYMLFSNGN